MAKVAGYFRISIARDGMQAPELYIDEIRRYCEFRRHELAETFTDIDRSGYNRPENRPGLQELVRRRGEFHAIVIPKLSRFGRSVRHLTELFDIFDRDQISLVFLDLGMDTSTSQGRLLRHIMAAFAEYESAIKGDYTRANNRRLSEAGRPWGGVAPYGYTRGQQTYEVDPATAEVVRLVFDLYAGGMSQYAIARELYQRRIASSQGKDVWQVSRVGRILDNPSYAGLILSQGDFLKGNWPPLIDETTWSIVFERRRVQRKAWTEPRRERRLLAGLIYCGDCGRRAYYVASGRGKTGRYRCGRADAVRLCEAPSTNATRAERYVADAFLERALMMVLQDENGRFVASERWRSCTPAERRVLLAAVIDRVVMEPSGIGVHPGRRGRKLTIHWKDGADPIREPSGPKGQQGTGQALALIRRQQDEIATRARVRSESSSRYFRDWSEHRSRSI